MHIRSGWNAPFCLVFCLDTRYHRTASPGVILIAPLTDAVLHRAQSWSSVSVPEPFPVGTEVSPGCWVGLRRGRLSRAPRVEEQATETVCWEGEKVARRGSCSSERPGHSPLSHWTYLQTSNFKIKWSRISTYWLQSSNARVWDPSEGGDQWDYTGWSPENTKKRESWLSLCGPLRKPLCYLLKNRTEVTGKTRIELFHMIEKSKL